MSEIYNFYLNGSFYGSGNLEYMKELFVDYVITCEMYGKDKCSFEIVKKERNKTLVALEELGKMKYSKYMPEETSKFYDEWMRK